MINDNLRCKKNYLTNIFKHHLFIKYFGIIFFFLSLGKKELYRAFRVTKRVAKRVAKRVNLNI